MASHGRRLLPRQSSLKKGELCCRDSAGGAVWPALVGPRSRPTRAFWWQLLLVHFPARLQLHEAPSHREKQADPAAWPPQLRFIAELGKRPPSVH